MVYVFALAPALSRFMWCRIATPLIRQRVFSWSRNTTTSLHLMKSRPTLIISPSFCRGTFVSMADINSTHHVFFTSNRTLARPYDCYADLPKRSRIYYNNTINPTSRWATCDCVVGFDADPDIAGPGVGEILSCHDGRSTDRVLITGSIRVHCHGFHYMLFCCVAAVLLCGTSWLVLSEGTTCFEEREPFPSHWDSERVSAV